MIYGCTLLKQAQKRATRKAYPTVINPDDVAKPHECPSGVSSERADSLAPSSPKECKCPGCNRSRWKHDYTHKNHWRMPLSLLTRKDSNMPSLHRSRPRQKQARIRSRWNHTNRGMLQQTQNQQKLGRHRSNTRSRPKGTRIKSPLRSSSA